MFILMCNKIPNKKGLKYDDIIIETPEVKKALERCSPAVVQSRYRRIIRAHDISCKQSFLPPADQATFNPFESYLTKPLAQAKKEINERQIINGKFR